MAKAATPTHLATSLRVVASHLHTRCMRIDFRHLIHELSTPPILIGHSFGGLFAEKLLGEGIGSAAIAIDPAQMKGVLPLPLAQLRSALPALANPLNLTRAVSLTKEEFRYGFGNTLTQQASDELHER
jgi:Alpha/beta hydrolase family